MERPIALSRQVITEAKQEVNKLLQGPPYNQNLIQINALFDRILNRLGFMAEVVEPENGKTTEQAFKPITNFMGTEIKRAPSTATEVEVPDTEKEKYLAKVDRLWRELPAMPPTIVLNSYTQPDDVLVLRGVAKRAGVPDFADKELTIPFIEEIIWGIAAVNEANTKQNKIDTDHKVTPVEKTATVEEIRDNGKLRQLKVKPGDKYFLYPDGRITLAV